MVATQLDATAGVLRVVAIKARIGKPIWDVQVLKRLLEAPLVLAQRGVIFIVLKAGEILLRGARLSPYVPERRSCISLPYPRESVEL